MALCGKYYVLSEYKMEIVHDQNNSLCTTDMIRYETWRPFMVTRARECPTISKKKKKKRLGEQPL